MAGAKQTALMAALVLAPVLAAAQAGTGGATPQAPQQQTAFAGRSLFTTYCASCHGTAGKGDGPIAASLKKRPTDLTQLAKANGGTYPADDVARSIDGREKVVAHGSDMPVWGDAFSKTKEDSDPESVRLKIRALVRHIETLQERPSSRD